MTDKTLALLKTVKSTVNADNRTSIVGNKYTNSWSEIHTDMSATSSAMSLAYSALFLLEQHSWNSQTISQASKSHRNHPTQKPYSHRFVEQLFSLETQ